ncbi:MAG: AI-2E family transporter [Haloarculaceae archaeon]
MQIPRGAGVGLDQKRLGWWVVSLGLAAVLGTIVAAFVGTLVFGLFCYYAALPVHRWITRRLDHPGLVAGLTLVTLVLPVLVLVGYGATVAYGELAALAGTDATRAVLARLFGEPGPLSALLNDPVAYLSRLEGLDRLQQGFSAALATLGFVGGFLLHLSLALALTFFLLRDGSRIEAWFLDEIADEESSAYAFLRGADADLETVYFGNVLSVLGVAVAAVLVYNGYDLLAPVAVDLPVPTLLALLTGLATFVPIVVGKLVYLPAGGYLLWEATRVDASLVYPVAFLLVSFLLLDILPQTVLRPLISGRSLHSGLVLFAYVLGAAYFGWYGLFLGPLLAVLGVQLLKHVLPDLVDGDPFVPEADEGVQIGSDPLAEEGMGGDHGADGEATGDGD